VGLQEPDDLQLLRSDVAPAVTIDATAEPPVLARYGNGLLNVGDVVLVLQRAVSLIDIVEGR
jgi:hypothetical protein